MRGSRALSLLLPFFFSTFACQTSYQSELKERVMRMFKLLAVIGVGVASMTSGVVAGSTDTCGEVNQELKVPQPLFPQNLIGVGIISEYTA